jgi:hypothetical protein
VEKGLVDVWIKSLILNRLTTSTSLLLLQLLV